MNGLSIIIPSKTFANVRSCAGAVADLDPGCRLIIVDDGLAQSGYRADSTDYESGACLDGTTIIPGDKPFVFARNCNLGMCAAGSDDVILCNDDALLRTPGGFVAMQAAAREHREFGIISATTNLAGNPDQQPRGIGLRDAGGRAVAFVCVFIPSRTLDSVGFLDERFTAYGWEDNDYCRRVREAGLRIGIFDGCFVDHGSLKSTFRGDPRMPADIRAGAQIYRQKWGDLN